MPRKSTTKPPQTSQLKIIAGRWRGRPIKFLQLEGVRPTPNRIRETLFNWLAPTINDARCLDLFAGSGILGIEALSRGASECTFLDLSAEVCYQIKAQLNLLDAGSHKVILSDTKSWYNPPPQKTNTISFFWTLPFTRIYCPSIFSYSKLKKFSPPGGLCT